MALSILEAQKVLEHLAEECSTLTPLDSEVIIMIRYNDGIEVIHSFPPTAEKFHDFINALKARVGLTTETFIPGNSDEIN